MIELLSTSALFLNLGFAALLLCTILLLLLTMLYPRLRQLALRRKAQMKEAYLKLLYEDFEPQSTCPQSKEDIRPHLSTLTSRPRGWASFLGQQMNAFSCPEDTIERQAQPALIQYLLRILDRRFSLHRPEALHLLSTLHLKSTSRQIAFTKALHFVRSSHAKTSFQALRLLIRLCPEAAPRLLGEYPHPLSPSQRVDLSLFLCPFLSRQVVSNLLKSPSENARLIGIALLREERPDCAQKALYYVLQRFQSQSHPDPSTIESLYTLFEMHHSLFCREILQWLVRLKGVRRKILLRHLIYLGYAPQSIAPILSPHEIRYLNALSYSYKCIIPSI